MRSHKRFAIRQEARLRGTSQRALPGLLIELSLDGCRIGNIDASKFALGQAASVLIDGFEPMDVYVRWAKDGCVGLRFQRPLHARALTALVDACRTSSTPRAAHA